MRKRLDIRSLRQERGDKEKAIESIESKAKAENRDITETEIADVDKALAEIEAIDGDIERAERLLAVRAAGARSVENDEVGPEPVPAARVESNQPKGLVFANAVRAIAAAAMQRASGTFITAVDIAKKYYQDALVVKALSEGTNSAGGYLVPQNFSAEYIDLLRNRAVLRRAGVRTIPLPNGNLKMPKGLTGSSSAYVGENATIAASQGTFGQLAFAAKKLATIVPMSNELLLDSSPDAAMIVRDDILASAALAEDVAMLRSDGTGNSPTGILNQTNAAHKFAATNSTTPTVANITADATKAIALLDAANVPLDGLFWVMAPRVFWYIASLRDGNGNFAFPGMQNESATTFFGIRVERTNQVPIALGVGTNESEIYLAAAQQLVIADTKLVEVAVSSEATYDSGGGTLVSAFANDQTLMRLIARHDFKMRYDKAAVVLTAVKWGA